MFNILVGSNWFGLTLSQFGGFLKFWGNPGIQSKMIARGNYDVVTASYDKVALSSNSHWLHSHSPIERVAAY